MHGSLVGRLVMDPTNIFVGKQVGSDLVEELHQNAAAPSATHIFQFANEKINADPLSLADHRRILRIVGNPVNLDVSDRMIKTTQETPRRPRGIETLPVFLVHLFPGGKRFPMIKLADVRLLEPRVDLWKILLFHLLKVERHLGQVFIITIV